MKYIFSPDAPAWNKSSPYILPSINASNASWWDCKTTELGISKRPSQQTSSFAGYRGLFCSSGVFINFQNNFDTNSPILRIQTVFSSEERPTSGRGNVCVCVFTFVKSTNPPSDPHFLDAFDLESETHGKSEGWRKRMMKGRYITEPSILFLLK